MFMIFRTWHTEQLVTFCTEPFYAPYTRRGGGMCSRSASCYVGTFWHFQLPCCKTIAVILNTGLGERQTLFNLDLISGDLDCKQTLNFHHKARP